MTVGGKSIRAEVNECQSVCVLVLLSFIYSCFFFFFLEGNGPNKAHWTRRQIQTRLCVLRNLPSQNTPTNKASSCFEFTEACVPGFMNQHTKVGVDYNEICDGIHACLPHNAVLCVWTVHCPCRVSYQRDILSSAYPKCWTAVCTLAERIVEQPSH